MANTLFTKLKLKCNTVSLKVNTSIIITIIVLNISCTTRDPESPISDRPQVIPPTSPNIVISNLVQSFKDKNIDSYVQAFAKDSSGTGFQFIFEPSAQAVSRYGSVFLSWNIQSERQYFLSLLSKLLSNSIPTLQFSGSRFEVLTPDSAVFVSNYFIILGNTNISIPSNYSGLTRITMKPQNNGFWYIVRWIDVSDDITKSNETWSELKARMLN